MLRTTANAVAKVNTGRPILFIITLHSVLLLNIATAMCQPVILSLLEVLFCDPDHTCVLFQCFPSIGGREGERKEKLEDFGRGCRQTPPLDGPKQAYFSRFGRLRKRVPTFLRLRRLSLKMRFDFLEGLPFR